jgi:hypothetical protein
MIKRHLRSEGVLCHLQGFYHRHLYYFFGPYLDISLMVGNDKAEFCRDIIKNYGSSEFLMGIYKILWFC